MHLFNLFNIYIFLNIYMYTYMYIYFSNIYVYVFRVYEYILHKYIQSLWTSLWTPLTFFCKNISLCWF